jgi:hypothetical protein
MSVSVQIELEVSCDLHSIGGRLFARLDQEDVFGRHGHVDRVVRLDRVHVHVGLELDCDIVDVG